MVSGVVPASAHSQAGPPSLPSSCGRSSCSVLACCTTRSAGGCWTGAETGAFTSRALSTDRQASRRPEDKDRPGHVPLLWVVTTQCCCTGHLYICKEEAWVTACKRAFTSHSFHGGRGQGQQGQSCLVDLDDGAGLPSAVWLLWGEKEADLAS